MKELIFTLKQHTPIIHFQHDQEGALLRGTEVKPKLDRFIWDLIGRQYERDWELVFEKYCNWLSGYSIKNHMLHKKEFLDGQRTALNYSMRFTTALVEKTIIPASDKRANAKQPFYFGNMGDGYELDMKSYHFTTGNITMELLIKSHQETDGNHLEKLISNNISRFFFEHNFGTRQNKGFGSFYPIPGSKGYIPPGEILNDSGNNPYSFSINVQGNNFLEKAKKCLSDMEIIYRAWRSGINTTSYGRSGLYLKSILWTYFKKKVNKNIKWEKRKTKERFFNCPQSVQIRNHTPDPGFTDSPLGAAGTDEMAIKDLMGLSSVESWGSYDKAVITKEVAGIDRFQSPVFFKPLLNSQNQYTVYFDAVPLQPDSSVLDKEITIKYAGSSFTIHTPSSFDFYDFFNYMIAEYSLENNLVIKLGDTLYPASGLDLTEKSGITEYRILKNFFNTLQ